MCVCVFVCVALNVCRWMCVHVGVLSVSVSACMHVYASAYQACVPGGMRRRAVLDNSIPKQSISCVY
jgi:hypothetical protein